MRASSEELINAVRDCRDKGMLRKDVGPFLGITNNQVRAICQTYHIRGWAFGSAARDQKGINNPNYDSGLSRSTLTRLTKQILQAEGRDLFTCERCAEKREIPWPRHHKDRNVKNNIPSNLEVLCVSCHSKEHLSERIRHKGAIIA